MTPSAPIADLSYRGYDGPLETPDYRWWAIAKMMIRLAIRRKGVWIAMLFSSWYYVAMIFVLFIFDQLAQQSALVGGRGNAQQGFVNFLSRIEWKDQFLHGFGFGQLMFLILALLLGAGTIANDNRANALLVYLSKPCSKLDYLLGKWLGVFIPLLFTMVAPATVFFLYGALSYRAEGFLSDDPWMVPKLLLLFPLSAAFLSSLVIGFSSFFNQGRLAGATFAGLYFLTNFFTQLMTAAFIAGREEGMPEAVRTIVSRLFYGSIDGVNIGIAKAILGTDGSAYFGLPTRMETVPAPPLWPMLLIVFLISVLCLFIAWKRIRAVEVVK